ncbi:MAG: glycosyltransferase [Deltaproteobacteria bacterium]|nr:glycosyltransferase [Deltaproteobacteria bacterium]
MTADNAPHVSLLIPTCNRCKTLQKALVSLADMDYPSDWFEVVVIDDGSTDGTGKMIALMRREVPFALVYSRQERLGIPAARNAGIRLSRGRILVFTDDDCRFQSDWLTRLSRHFDTPNLGAVGVPDRNPPDGPFFSQCVDYAVNSLAGSGGVRQKAGARLARYLPRGFGMAIPRPVIEAVGGFDETLAAGEDIELSYRVRKGGYLVSFDPDAFVWHERRGTPRSFIRQMFTRGFTRIELVRRHRGMMEPAYFFPLVLVAGFTTLACASVFFSLARPVLFGVTAFYGIGIGAAGLHGAARLKDGRAIFVIPVLLALQHLMYGLGTLAALVVPNAAKAEDAPDLRRQG